MVPRMSLSDLPVLYSFRRCPYAMRARLAIAASGTVCQLREVVLRDKPEAMLQASPKGTVPVVVAVDGEVIDESLDIMRWALTRNDPGRWLQPEQGDAAEMLELIGRNDSDFKRDLDRYKYPDRHAHREDFSNAADYAARHRASAAQWLQELDARIAAWGYLMGSRPCLADMAIAPFVRQFAQVDRDWFDAQPWPALSQWLADWLVSPLLASIMFKYPAWTPDAEPVHFPP